MSDLTCHRELNWHSAWLWNTEKSFIYISVFWGTNISVIQTEIFKQLKFKGFPGGSLVKNPPVNAGDTGSIPVQGRSQLPWSN